jgi:hypothetical protein
VGGAVAPIVLAGAVPHDLGARTRGLGSLCGGVVLVALFVAKFVGPPPRRFPVRAALAAVMFAIAVYADVRHLASNVPAAIDLLLGLILLSWYARE